MNNSSESNGQKGNVDYPSPSSSSPPKKLPTVDPSKTIPYLKEGLKRNR